MQNYLMAVTPDYPGNYGLGIKNRCWGVLTEYKKRIQRLRPGDRIFFLVEGQFRGLCTVESAAYESHEQIWPDDNYPWRVKLSAPVCESFAKFGDLAPELSFTQKRESHAGTVQGANGILKRINENDARRIEEAMQKNRLVDLSRFLGRATQ